MKKTYERSAWMAVLAGAPLSELERHWSSVSHPVFQWIRRPEQGAIMLRGRVGRAGTTFNVGEATVTRCTLQIETGEIGLAYVLGRSKRHAALAALLDGLMQKEQMGGGDVISSIINSLDHYSDERRRETLESTYRSKVEFFMYGPDGAQ